MLMKNIETGGRFLMQKYLKWMFVISLSLFLLLPFNLKARAASSPELFNLPVVLKINRYYVLYTYPKPPYVDAQNRLIVPLGTVCRDLIGTKVNYDYKTKTALINWFDHKVKLTVGSKTAFVDEKQVEMDTVPVLYKNSMLVPMRILTEGLEIKVKWDQKYHFTFLEDERLMKTEKIKFGPEDSPALRASAVEENAFFPLSCRIKISYPTNSSTPTKTKLEIAAQNITGKDIPEGKADVRPHLMFNGGYTTLAFYGSEGELAPIRPPVKAEEIIKISKEFSSGIPSDFPKGIEKLSLVLLTCRVLA